MSVKNSTTSIPEVFYGLHFYPGVAEYPEKSPGYRVLVNEQTIRSMDATFCGRPVYVKHVDEVNIDKIQLEADGYVIESFYNQADGKHWCKFLVVTDEGKKVIKNGWRLSNAYSILSSAPGGTWNGVAYQEEVMNGEFDHLALVPNPRYQESIILTPEEFKAYNIQHTAELQKVANSSTLSNKMTGMFKFFKKSETEVKELDAANTLVTLKNGKTVSIADLIANADLPESEPTPIAGGAMNEDKGEGKESEEVPKEAPKEEPKEEKEEGKEEHKEGDKNPAEDDKQGGDKGDALEMASMDHHVMINDMPMKVSQLVSEHQEMKNCMATLSKHMQPMKAHNSESTEPKIEVVPEVKTPIEAPVVVDMKHFNDLKNAHNDGKEGHIVTNIDSADRGKSRYGSKR